MQMGFASTPAIQWVTKDFLVFSTRTHPLGYVRTVVRCMQTACCAIQKLHADYAQMINIYHKVPVCQHVRPGTLAWGRESMVGHVSLARLTAARAVAETRATCVASASTFSAVSVLANALMVTPRSEAETRAASATSALIIARGAHQVKLASSAQAMRIFTMAAALILAPATTLRLRVACKSEV